MISFCKKWSPPNWTSAPYSSIVNPMIPLTSFIIPSVLSLACVHNTTWLDHLAADKDILYSWLLERDMVVMVCCHYQRFWLRHKYNNNNSTKGHIIIGKKKPPPHHTPRKMKNQLRNVPFLNVILYYERHQN